jgi:hypothetical protein
MHSLINSIWGLIHHFRRAIHNLKKFFAFWLKKYTLVVNKDLPANILLSKKENINDWEKKSPRRKQGEKEFFYCRVFISCYLLPADSVYQLAFDPVLVFLAPVYYQLVASVPDARYWDYDSLPDVRSFVYGLRY